MAEKSYVTDCVCTAYVSDKSLSYERIIPVKATSFLFSLFKNIFVSIIWYCSVNKQAISPFSSIEFYIKLAIDS